MSQLTSWLMNPSPIVLIVEDDPITQEILARYLHQAGFGVLLASDGEDALMLLRQTGSLISWVVTDIHLPGMINGWVVGAEFHLTHPFRPVIYTSASKLEAHKRAAGGVFLPKPYCPALLVALVTELSATADFDHRAVPDRLAALLAQHGVPEPDAISSLQQTEEYPCVP